MGTAVLAEAPARVLGHELVDQDPPELRPAILVDVDGVLNPDKPGPGYRSHRIIIDRTRYRVWLNPEHGVWLQELAEETGAELMWATFWNEHANVHIGPRLGLPRIPVIEIDESYDELCRRGSLSDQLAEWKAACVGNQIGRRPFVWFDDEEGLSEHLMRQPVGPSCVVPVGSSTGLARSHISLAREWLSERFWLLAG